MSKHLAPRPLRRRVSTHRARRPILGSRRLRGILSLGILVGLGGIGTLAYWTDDATVTTGSFTSGTLDVTLNDALAGQANNGGTTADAAFALTDLIPGESVARTVKVGNAGSIPLAYTAKAWNTGALAVGLRWTVVAGSTSSNAGTVAAGNRTGSCSSGTTTATNVTLGTASGSATTVLTPNRTIATGAFENVCVIATLDSGAGNSLQGASASATVTFNGVQVGSP